MTSVNEFTFFNEAQSAANSPVLTVKDGESIVFGVSGTFSAEITAQGYLGGEWYDLLVVGLADGEKSQSISAAGAYTVPCAYGFSMLRLVISSYTSGSVSAVGRICRTV